MFQSSISYPEKNILVMKRLPLNRILYGPPGTGKTDRTVEMSLEILGRDSSDNDPVSRRKTNRETFRSLLNRKIFFVTFHPSFSYEDFVEGIRPKTSENKELLFEPKPGIFMRVCEQARKLYEEDGMTMAEVYENSDILKVAFFLSKFNTKEKKSANLFFGSESNGVVFAKVGELLGVNPNSIKNHRDKFDFVASDERKGWTPRTSVSGKLDNSTMWPYDDTYQELKNKSFGDVQEMVKGILDKKDKERIHQENNISVVLILDEINRANISTVFGELITLLEEDKRMGMDNELSLTLPSGREFSIPPNLYVIGTMNTADRSIALVDLALRRRFRFIPMYPDLNVVERFGNVDRSEKLELMRNVNRLLISPSDGFFKGVDFQIGHAYFLDDRPIAEVIDGSVIPLLTEYFRNDLSRVKSLLEQCGIEMDSDLYEGSGLLACKRPGE